MREIEAFLAVAEELHFGRAAQRLGLSTSRISALVRTLERRVGGPLFERTSRTVQLTSPGEYLLAELRPAHARMEQAFVEVRKILGVDRQVIRVGFATTLPQQLPGLLVKEFEQAYPGCRVVQSSHPTAEFSRWLGKEWPIDVFVTWLPDEPARLALPEIDFGPAILRESRAVAVAADHPLAGKPSVSIEELAGHEVLSFVGAPTGYARAWTPAQTPAGRPMRLRTMAAHYIEDILRIVSGEGAAHLTFTSLLSRYKPPGIVVLPVAGLPPMVVAPLWPAQTANTAIQTFATLAAAQGDAAGWLGTDHDA